MSPWVLSSLIQEFIKNSFFVRGMHVPTLKYYTYFVLSIY